MDLVAEVHQAPLSSDSDDELPPSEAAKSRKKKRKRELVTADFTEEQEQEMVDWLRAPEQECLLNKKHPNYIKKGLKDALWDEKAREMGKTSDQLKKWYANMRSRFGKLKLTPSGFGNSELTARDRWILHHFEFLRPYLIVQVKKRRKAKVQARTAPAAAEPALRSESESEATGHHRPAAAPSDPDTSLGSRSRAAEVTEATWSNIAELQRQLLNRLSKAGEKSPMQRQKDTFADFLKEVTYTFPPTMWLRFQSDINSLMLKYQLELHQQTQQQEQDKFRRPCPPAPIPGPGGQRCHSVGWRPAQVHQPTSVWGSQESKRVQEQFQQQPQSNHSEYQLSEMALTQVSSNKCAGGFQKVFEHDSTELKCKMKFAVYVPPKAETDKCPVMYWLSGLTCTEQNFITKAGSQLAAAEHGIIIVAPDTSPRGCNIEGEDENWDFGTGAGFYVDATQDPWKTNYRMYSYITEELPKLINANFPTDPDRMSVSGHSMGGHGALICALKNPGKYKAVSAFAPICNPVQCPWGQKAFSGYLGPDKSSWEAYDATVLAAAYSGPQLDILIDQGRDDQFLSASQLLPDNLIAVCSEKKIPVVFRLQPGYDHSYFFIYSFINDHIKHHAKFLNA